MDKKVIYNFLQDLNDNNSVPPTLNLPKKRMAYKVVY
jgi:hypothetical protein